MKTVKELQTRLSDIERTLGRLSDALSVADKVLDGQRVSHYLFGITFYTGELKPNTYEEIRNVLVFEYKELLAEQAKITEFLSTLDSLVSGFEK